MKKKLSRPKTKNLPEWQWFFHTLAERLAPFGKASVTQISQKADPFRTLIATVISLRTKDQTTLNASERLFSLADSPHTMRQLTKEKIEQAIYPAGFYHRKAEQIINICHILVTQHGGLVPNSEKSLLALPGVGRKTANLVLGLGFGIPAICVDTHVHRISNRMGWTNTKTPEETEMALYQLVPQKYWIRLNSLLVVFGQKICTPISPHCSCCLFFSLCERRDVRTTRKS